MLEPVVLGAVGILIPPVAADEAVIGLVQAARVRFVPVHSQADRIDACRGRVVALAADVKQIAGADLRFPGRKHGRPRRGGARPAVRAEAREVVGRVVFPGRDDDQLAGR